jgi:hypothetical protein
MKNKIIIEKRQLIFIVNALVDVTLCLSCYGGHSVHMVTFF